MDRHREFRSARASREPLVATFPPDDRYPEGRRIEFPPDLNSGQFLDFAATFGEYLTADEMPLAVIKPFMELVCGDRIDEVREQLTVSELNDVAGWLYVSYIVLAAQQAGGDAAGKALASMTSSTNGEASKQTSGVTTE